jgi:hypothetical protein
MGYAGRVNLNAFRIWASYEYWRREPDRFRDAFDDFLAAAAEHGICVLPSLFESCGVAPTDAHMWDTDSRTAVCVSSPDKETVVADESRWGEPGEFVDWFMDRYRDDGRLLGVEVFNEPVGVTMRFARAMFRRAAARRGRVPLSIGSIALADNLYFLDLGLDILQYHDNFPTSLGAFRKRLEEAVWTMGVLEKPVWLTEVQRLRSEDGWGSRDVPAEERLPDLASLLATVRESGVGFFFWSLMLKPAYLPSQRGKGTINGLFHEDGAVWSRADARAVAGDPDLQLTERRERPAWMVQ